MPIPPGHDAFSWTRVQAALLNKEVDRAKIFFEEWANLTPAQKTGVRNRASNTIDTVTAELTDIKSTINGL